MRKLILLIQNYQTQISTALLFLSCVALVVYLSPREAKFKYEFQKSKPWQHENLLAPFDFAIDKTEEELSQEKEKLQAGKTIFIRFDEAVSNQVLDNYRSDFQVNWNDALAAGRFQLDRDSLNLLNLRDSLLNVGVDELTKLLEAGILQPNENPLFESYGEVLFQKQGLSESVDLNEFSSIRKAAEQARDGVQSLFDSELASFLAARISANLRYNVFFDLETTQAYLDNQINSILPTRGMVEKGELIVGQGNLVDEARFAKLNSLKQVYEGSLSGSNSYYGLLFGQILLNALLFFAIFAYLRQFDRLVLEDVTRLSFILLNILIMVGVASLIAQWESNFLYLVPFAILPMVIRSFFDIRLALFIHFITTLLIAFQVPNSFEFVLLQFVAGVFSVLLVNNLYKRRDLFITAAKITLVYAVSYFSLAILQEGSLDGINYTVFAYFMANGLLTLVSFPLIYFEERLFGLVSEISLLELSDTNNPLLREMAETAPGTFQHVMQVANLTENACLAIGGNALLARTGALYHDIGKMQSPMYFIENQSTGINPHDELSFEESAEIIIGHVSAGIQIAKKHKLPDVLIDFIRTHHGTSTVMYFYRQYIKDFPEDEMAMEKFTYPGPKPFSKETAVLMMADTVEAASRSIQNPDHDQIDGLVERLIDAQIASAQFENAPITLKEIRTVKKIFKKMLMNIYHVRIKYPD